MTFRVLHNEGQPHLSALEVGDTVFGGYLGFLNDLKTYSYRHRLDCVTMDGESWIDCKTLLKFVQWLKPEQDTAPFIAFLRKQGAFSTKRKLNQTHRIHIMYTQKYKCMMCDELLKPDCHLDHVVPLEDGGQDSVENLQALCVSCHSQKTYDHRLQQHPLFSNATIKPVKTSTYFEQFECKRHKVS